MARTEVIQYEDDLTGDAITDNDAPTVSFALDGTEYEIDLSVKNADQLRKALEPYISKARRVGSKSKGKRASSGVAAADVRAWGLTEGVHDSGRGRIGSDLKDAYNKANPERRYN